MLRSMLVVLSLIGSQAFAATLCPTDNKAMFEAGELARILVPSDTNETANWGMYTVRVTRACGKIFTCSMMLAEEIIYFCDSNQNPGTCPGMGCPNIGSSRQIYPALQGKR